MKETKHGREPFEAFKKFHLCVYYTIYFLLFSLKIFLIKNHYRSSTEVIARFFKITD